MQLTEAQWEAQKCYPYHNILLSSPNRSRRRINATNWFCGIALFIAIAAAIWLK